MEKKRLPGITLIGITSLIFGFSRIYVFFKYFSRFAHYEDVIMNLLLGVLFIPSGWGILRLKNWARFLFIFSLIFTIVGFFVLGGISNLRVFGSIIHRDVKPLEFIFGILFFIIGGLLPIIYLTRPKVKEQFLSQKK